jgi:hypothetical protein
MDRLRARPAKMDPLMTSQRAVLIEILRVEMAIFVATIG